VYRDLDGLLWPQYDSELRRVNYQVQDLDRAFGFLKKNRSVVQAGGACGVWANKLSRIFDKVYTFEPDPGNFTCLSYNTRRVSNVVRFQAALGDRHGMIDLHNVNNHNAGSIYVKVSDCGFIPMMKIDDFELNDVDMIALDVEGWEYFALVGAMDTIRRCDPVIMMEVKRLKHNYRIFGDTTVTYMSASNFLKDLGYKEVDRIHRDVIFTK
jgi:FkbM family methyltransferase